MQPLTTLLVTPKALARLEYRDESSTELPPLAEDLMKVGWEGSMERHGHMKPRTAITIAS